jgi:hypothetical protein
LQFNIAGPGPGGTMTMERTRQPTSTESRRAARLLLQTESARYNRLAQAARSPEAMDYAEAMLRRGDRSRSKAALRRLLGAHAHGFVDADGGRALLVLALRVFLEPLHADPQPGRDMQPSIATWAFRFGRHHDRAVFASQNLAGLIVFRHALERVAERAPGMDLVQAIWSAHRAAEQADLVQAAADAERVLIPVGEHGAFLARLRRLTAHGAGLGPALFADTYLARDMVPERRLQRGLARVPA